MTDSRGRVLWQRSPEAEADMERLCRELSWKDVRDRMRELWGIELTRAQVKNFRARHEIRNGLVGGRFERGQEPWNKGKAWDEYMSPEAQERSRATCFRTGEMSGAARDRWRPVGSEVVHADGTVWVKVGDEPARDRDLGRRAAAAARMRRWRQRSHVVYEEAFGPIPEGCHVVHADGDPSNDDPDNLVAVPMRLRSTIAHSGAAYADRETLEVAMLMAEVTQAASPRRNRGRGCADARV